MGKNISIIGVVFFFILGLFSLTFSQSPEQQKDEFVISTYYPSPYGSYNELTTYSNTYLAVNSGNVGIGTTAPGAYKLNVEGDLIADTFTIVGGPSLPDCNFSNRGKQFLVQGPSGTEDKLYMCKKKADGNYDWIAF